MMAEFEYVLMAERKDNSDGKIIFGLFLLARTFLLNQWTYDREQVYNRTYISLKSSTHSFSTNFIKRVLFYSGVSCHVL